MSPDTNERAAILDRPCKAEPRQRVKSGKLEIHEFEGVLVIAGLSYTPDEGGTAVLDTFGSLRLHTFNREQLLALAEVATYTAARVDPLPDQAGGE